MLCRSNSPPPLLLILLQYAGSLSVQWMTRTFCGLRTLLSCCEYEQTGSLKFQHIHSRIEVIDLIKQNWQPGAATYIEHIY